jgi:hypothetical protein
MYFKAILIAIGFVSLVGWASPAQADGRVQPVYNVVDAAIATGSGNEPTLAQVEQAISAAATYKRWTVHRIDDGHLAASIHVRKHFAKVDITFTTEVFSIKYLDSKVLRYDGTNIHRNYNKWIILMERRIHHNLNAL